MGASGADDHGCGRRGVTVTSHVDMAYASGCPQRSQRAWSFGLEPPPPSRDCLCLRAAVRICEATGRRRLGCELGDKLTTVALFIAPRQVMVKHGCVRCTVKRNKNSQ